MCKELPVILVNKVVDPKRIIGKKWRAEEEERHKGSPTPQKPYLSWVVYLLKQAVKLFSRASLNGALQQSSGTEILRTGLSAAVTTCNSL
jgi:hypothetical protein